jgi:membrane protease YdiL (CAAX protease family)
LDLINHLLVFITLILLPLKVFLDTRKLKESSNPSIKEKTYFKLFALYWTITSGFLIFSPFKGIFFTSKPLQFNGTGKLVALLVLFYLIITQIIPVLLLRFNKKLRALTAESFNEKSYIFPTSDRQRALFWIVPFTVGICEEIIFRGYLYHYFQSTPYSLSALLSFLLVTVIFGLGHFQQGLSGIVLTTLLGYFLGFLYFLTGNLLLPIFLHIIFDAKILLISSTLSKHKPHDTSTSNM